MRKITNINLSITTHCNMSCPDCCCNITSMGIKNREFYPWEYFEKCSKYFYGIDRIHLTGGEPTIHPEFERFAYGFKKLFGCKLLTLETNGSRLDKISAEVFMNFNFINVSHYTDKTFEGCVDNTNQIEILKLKLKETSVKINAIDIVHTPRSTNSGTKMCAKGRSETVAYRDGEIFPCCVGPGLSPKISIPLSDDWIKKIQNVRPPCSKCFFVL